MIEFELNSNKVCNFWLNSAINFDSFKIIIKESAEIIKFRCYPISHIWICSTTNKVSTKLSFEILRIHFFFTANFLEHSIVRKERTVDFLVWKNFMAFQNLFFWVTSSFVFWAICELDSIVIVKVVEIHVISFYQCPNFHRKSALVLPMAKILRCLYIFAVIWV